MRNRLLFIFTLFIFQFSYSQDFKHPSTLGIHFFLNDFENKNFLRNFSKMDAGISISYLKGISPHFDYNINISGSFPDSVSNHIIVTGKKSLLLQSDFSIRARLLNKQSWIQPFVAGGVGVSHYKENFVAYFLVGPGIEFNYKDIYFTTTAQ